MEKYFRELDKKRKKKKIDLNVNMRFSKENNVEYVPLKIPKKQFYNKHDNSKNLVKNKAGIYQL